MPLGHFFALTIYGLEESMMPLSHSKNKTLQIIGPMFNKVDLSWQNRVSETSSPEPSKRKETDQTNFKKLLPVFFLQTYGFPSIRVNQPGDLMVEGQPVVSKSKGGQAANPTMNVFTTTS